VANGKETKEKTAVAIALLSLFMLMAPSPSAGRQKHQQSQRHAPTAYTVPTEQPTPTPAPTPVDAGVQPQPCPTEKQPDTGEKACWWPPPGDSDFWPNWALVIAAIWAGCIAFRTLSKIGDQIEKSDRALRLDQRPWVVLTENHEMNVFFNGELPRPGVKFPVRIELRNTGRTPAIRLTAELVSGLVRAPTTIDLPTSMTFFGAKPMGFLTRPFAVGHGIIHQLIATVQALDESDYTDVFESPISGHLIICGVLKYGDHLTEGQPYETKFCLLWMPLDNRFYLSGPHNGCT
jgi:hypothetical protein